MSDVIIFVVNVVAAAVAEDGEKEFGRDGCVCGGGASQLSFVSLVRRSLCGLTAAAAASLSLSLPDTDGDRRRGSLSTGAFFTVDARQINISGGWKIQVVRYSLY